MGLTEMFILFGTYESVEMLKATELKSCSKNTIKKILHLCFNMQDNLTEQIIKKYISNFQQYFYYIV